MIGVFDSGYGGLTILQSVRTLLPQYHYIYLGDNARNPYGTRSFDVVYRYTLQCVRRLYDMGAQLIILACNTASAKALRSIQQRDLANIAKPHQRVLGVIRPSAEVLGTLTRTGKIGVMATQGTVSSESYPIEINKLWPKAEVYQQACPMWVPLVENHEFEDAGADYFVRKYCDALMEQCPSIDTVLLACTHYPLLLPKIRQCLPEVTTIVSQGEIVAESLSDYLRRHADLERLLRRDGQMEFYTTESAEKFAGTAKIFFKGDLAINKVLVA